MALTQFFMSTMWHIHKNSQPWVFCHQTVSLYWCTCNKCACNMLRLCWQLGASVVQNQMSGRVEASWIGNMLSDEYKKESYTLQPPHTWQKQRFQQGSWNVNSQSQGYSFMAIWSHIECTDNKHQVIIVGQLLNLWLPEASQEVKWFFIHQKLYGDSRTQGLFL